MTTPESGQTPAWNPEIAVPLFTQLAEMQKATGIFAGYEQGLAAYIEDTGDREDMADTMRALQGDTTLGVIGEEDFDEGAPRHRDLYLAEINPQDGSYNANSILFSGYTFDVAVDQVFVSGHQEGEPPFTLDQAKLISDQYRLQESAGLHVNGEPQV